MKKSAIPMLNITNKKLEYIFLNRRPGVRIPLGAPFMRIDTAMICGVFLFFEVTGSNPLGREGRDKEPGNLSHKNRAVIPCMQ